MLRQTLGLLCLFAALLGAQTKSNTAELERIEDLIHQLGEMKIKVAVMETQLDTLLRALSEQRGALQQKPQTYNALAHVEADNETSVPKNRCAALTANGKRCSRPAKPNSRYCAQHELSHVK